MSINKITDRLKAVSSGRLKTAACTATYTSILAFAIGFISGKLL